MVLRRMASAFLRTEKRFKLVMSHRDFGPWNYPRPAADRQPEGGVVTSTQSPFRNLQLAAGHARLLNRKSVFRSAGVVCRGLDESQHRRTWRIRRSHSKNRRGRFTRMSYDRRAGISNAAELHSGCDERHARSKLNCHNGNRRTGFERGSGVLQSHRNDRDQR